MAFRIRSDAHRSNGTPRRSSNARAASSRPSRPNARKSSRVRARCAHAADHRVRAAIDERQAFSDPGQDRRGVDPARGHGGSAGRQEGLGGFGVRGRWGCPFVGRAGGDDVVEIAAVKAHSAVELVRDAAVERVEMREDGVARGVGVARPQAPVGERQGHDAAQLARAAQKPRVGFVALEARQHLRQPLRVTDHLDEIPRVLAARCAHAPPPAAALFTTARRARSRRRVHRGSDAPPRRPVSASTRSRWPARRRPGRRRSRTRRP